MKQAKEIRSHRSIDNITNFFVTIVCPPKVEFTTSICQYRGTPLFFDHRNLFDKYSKSGIRDAEAVVVVAAIDEVVSVQEAFDFSVTSPIDDTDTVQSESVQIIVPDISVVDKKKLKKLMNDVRTLLPKKHILVDISGEIGEELHRLVKSLVPPEKKRKK